MSALSDLRGRIRTLREIRSIMNAMKNLALAELNKIARSQKAQEEMARTVDEAFRAVRRCVDLSSFLPGSAPGRIFVLIGSERGFCGAFNDSILKRFEEERSKSEGPFKILAVGRKIGLKISESPPILEILDGPGTAEEIPGIIKTLADRLAATSGLEWIFITHQGEDSPEKTTAIRPFSDLVKGPDEQSGNPPLLTLPIPELVEGLLEHILFVVLYRAFYLSFLVENRARFLHMDGALNTLDKNLEELQKRGNILRQEEITEELEVILLGIREGPF